MTLCTAVIVIDSPAEPEVQRSQRAQGDHGGILPAKLGEKLNWTRINADELSFFDRINTIFRIFLPDKSVG